MDGAFHNDRRAWKATNDYIMLLMAIYKQRNLIDDKEVDYIRDNAELIGNERGLISKYYLG